MGLFLNRHPQPFTKEPAELESRIRDLERHRHKFAFSSLQRRWCCHTFCLLSVMNCHWMHVIKANISNKPSSVHHDVWPNKSGRESQQCVLLWLSQLAGRAKALGVQNHSLDVCEITTTVRPHRQNRHQEGEGCTVQQALTTLSHTVTAFIDPQKPKNISC